MITTTTTDFPPMTAEEFIVWAIEQPETERYELHDGVVLAMTNEGHLHGEIKALFTASFVIAMREAGVNGQVFTSETNVEGGRGRVFKPDVVVRLGDRLPPRGYLVTDPVIVVELLSSSTKSRDTGIKLRGYQSVPTLHHYLIVNPDKRIMIHHRRANDGSFQPIPHGDGPLTLDPPGITIEKFFP